MLLSTVKRTIVLVLAVVLAACDGGETTTTVPGPTTTIDPEVRCAQISQDAGEMLIEFVNALENVSPSQLSDRALWPNELVALEQRGEELDQAITEAGCDVLEIQAGIIEQAAELEAENLVARLYLEQLLQIGS